MKNLDTDFFLIFFAKTFCSFGKMLYFCSRQVEGLCLDGCNRGLKT